MSYSVKEIYLTLQGEGFHTGKHAVFCRFSGCNLWTGLEKDREKAICNFCDTDFVGTDGINGAKYSSAYKLANKIFGNKNFNNYYLDNYIKNIQNKRKIKYENLERLKSNLLKYNIQFIPSRINDT